MVTNSLGAAAAVSGDTAIVADANGNFGTGAVFAMVRTGSDWNQQGPRWITDCPALKPLAKLVSCQEKAIVLTDGRRTRGMMVICVS
jgi:hypothetical protein